MVPDSMPRVLIFDVNETLLDLSAVRPRFSEAFGSADLMGEWFARMLHASLVVNAIGAYQSFGELGAGQLLALAARRGVELDADGAREVVAGMRALPPHPDVGDGLERLASSGYRLAALTNGATDVLADQLSNGGIAQFFERAISVEEVGCFKPASEPYLHAARALDVPAGSAMMVAAHDWDVAGALSAGLDAAFLQRPGATWSLPQPVPATTAPDLISLAERLDRPSKGP